MFARSGTFRGAFNSRNATGLLSLLAALVALLLPMLGGQGFAAGGDPVADRVLGQPNFSSGWANNSGISATGLSLPTGVAVAGTGRVFVADKNNNRVLSWPSATSFSNGQAADLVLGQPDFGSNTANNGGVGAASLRGPTGVAVDGSGHLFVADNLNNRVLRYSPPFSSHQAADMVLGQPDFTSSTFNNGGIGARSLGWPWGIAVDGSGSLLVVDRNNNRVLRYSPPLSNYQEADLVLGQPDFYSRNPNYGGVSATALSYPFDIGVNGSGQLFVSDGNHRVLRYSPPFSNRQAADLVLGQPYFTSYGANYWGLNANGLNTPRGVALNASGQLFVADMNNNRVLRYSPPFSNHQAADLVLGQRAFTNNTANYLGVSDASLYSPSGIAIHGGLNILVADGNNNRVLAYDEPSKYNTGLAAASASGTYGGSVTLSATLTSNGTSLCLRYIDFWLNGSLKGSAYTDCTGGATLNNVSLAGLSAGSYPASVAASFAGLAQYEGSSAEASLQVNPAPLTITADNQTKVYGAPLPTLTVSYSGFVNGDTPAALGAPPLVATSATAASDASGSPYAITASGAAATNYNISYVPGSLTITPAPATVRYSGVTRVFAGAPIWLAATVTQAVPGFGGDMTRGAVTFRLTDAGGNSTSHGPRALAAGGVATENIPAGLLPGVYSINAQLDPANGNFEGAPATTMGLIVTDPSAPLRAVQYYAGSPWPGYSYQLPFFTFWQKVRIQNVGATLAKQVKAYIQRVSANTTIVDGEVTVGDIPAGGSRWSADTYSLKVDLTMPPSRCDSFTWRIEYDDDFDELTPPRVLDPVPQFPPGLAPGGCR